MVFVSNFRSGLFWGAFFGGLAGLMNAPRSGKETREKIKNIIDQTTDDVNDVRFKVDNLKIAIQRLQNESIRSSKIISEELQTTLQHFNEETQPRLRRVQDSASTLAKNLEKSMDISKP